MVVNSNLTRVSIVDHFQWVGQQVVIANHVHRRHMNGRCLKGDQIGLVGLPLGWALGGLVLPGWW